VADTGFLSAQELGAAYRRRELSPADAVRDALERSGELDRTLHAFAVVDQQGAMAAARASEARFARGTPIGLLDGIPVSVKDLLFVKGSSAAAGSMALRDFVPDTDEIAVERLRAAGAIILGKTSVPELGFGPGTQSPLVGVSRNPWDPTRTPGGSSGGSAVAVAAGMGPVALGTDAGGSIRAPASFCGIVGLKPSFGRVAMYPAARDERFPVFAGFETFDVVGPMTRTVDDAALVLDAIAGPDPRDRHSLARGIDGFLQSAPSRLDGLRIGWTLDLGSGVGLDAEVALGVTSAISGFVDVGAHVEPVTLDLGDTRPTFAPIAALELGALRRWVAEHPEAANDRVRRLLDEAWTFTQVSDAMVARRALAEVVARWFDGFDLLVTPTTPVTAYPTDHELPERIGGAPSRRAYDLSVFTAPFTLTGNPAISIPCGWTPDGLPVGIQIVGGHLADALVLRAARAFEEARPWAERRPAFAIG